MSQFIVSARKYRPTRFEEVLGQEHISHTLKMAMSQNKLAHAFLFTGPRGVGKTTCARILAKSINCLNPSQDFDPCDICESCKSFNESASFSIFELDAASNNSVDHIRSLNDQVRIPPFSGKYKIFIIDEVHMLSSSAFNAFLKTLEEPPSYAIFILATTEKHKILPTILSRCQIFDFRRLQVKDIVKQLNLISKEEKIKSEPEALHMIATKADGAMRDALSIFDRISGANNGKVTLESVVENLNILDYSYFFRITDFLVLEDVSNIMLHLDEIMRKGFDPEVFLTGLAEHFRQLLVSKDQATIVLIENTDAVREKFRSQSEMIPIEFLVTALDLCNECDIHFRTARNKRLHLEMTLLKLIYLRRASEIDTMVLAGIEKKKIDEPIVQLQVPSEKLEIENKPSFETKKQITKTIDALSSETYKSELTNPSKNSDKTLISEADAELIEEVNAFEEPSTIQPIKNNLALEDGQTLQKIQTNPLGAKETKSKLKHFEAKAKHTIQTESVSPNAYSQEDVEKLMTQYNIKASDTIRLILESREIAEIVDDVIKITVGSVFEKESLINEMPLLEFLRHNLNNKRIRIECQIDSNLIKNIEDLKPLSAVEKLEKLNEANPLLKSLFEKMNLKIDE